MATQWVDFAQIRGAVRIGQVLERYGIDWLQEVRGELVGRCPVHGSSDLQSKAFRANGSKGIWKCFSCGQGGNVVDLVAALESVTPHEAAVKLAEWFSLQDAIQVALPRGQRRRSGEVGDSVRSGGEEASKRRPAGKIAVGGGGARQPNPLSERTAATPPAAGINPPLPFELKGLDAGHPYLAERRMDPSTVKTFGMGYCAKGMLRGRIAIPVHDHHGYLVGYAGRLVPDQVELAQEAEAEGAAPPTYRFPSREKGFHKRYLLFNLNRVGEEARRRDGLVIVEGFFDCFRLHQVGVRNVVALMGCQLSEEQEQLLLERTDRVTLALDQDEAGRQGTQDILQRLVRKCYVRILDYPTLQPDELSEGQVRSLFGLRP